MKLPAVPLTLLTAFAMNPLVACGSSTGAGPDEAPDASPRATDGAVVDNRPLQPSPEAGVERPPTAADANPATACHDLAPGPEVRVKTLAAVPRMTGGVIRDGTYQLIDVGYLNASSGDRFQQVLAIAGTAYGMIQSLTRDNGEKTGVDNYRDSGTVATSGTELTLTRMCGGRGPLRYEYTATADGLVIGQQSILFFTFRRM